METRALSPRDVRFGVFEADLQSRELRKQGRKVPLQDQPFQILALLLRRPGEIVTREELQAALWPADTFVEFEHGVNTAIQKLRRALGDSADNPRFIETLPRKGYRFIAPVGQPGPQPIAAHAGSRRLPVVLGSVALAAVAVGCTLWLLNRPGKSPAATPVPVPLTSYPGFEGNPSFSPEGDRVAFSWNGPKQDNYDIYIKLADNNDEPQRLTTDPAEDSGCAWSPDGRWIAFLRRFSDERTGIFLIPAVGGIEKKITETSGMGRIAWHPDSRGLIVSDSNAAGEPVALYLVSVETGEKRKLTSPPQNTLGDIYAAVSPDGRTLAFTRASSAMIADLYVLDLSNAVRPIGEPRRITFMGGCEKEPAWWPDGKSILFTSGPSCLSGALWRMAVSEGGRPGGKPERLPFGGEGHGHHPAISRQGRIAYLEHVVSADIYRLDLANGHAIDKPPLNSTRVDHVPQYSPDGKRIAFVSNRSGNLEVWLSNADGSDVFQFTSFGGLFVAEAAWAPDGLRIAINTGSGIYIASTEHGKPQPLAGRNYVMSTWSRDGKWLYVNRKRPGGEEVWRIPADGGAAVQVNKNGGGAVESSDGKFVYYLRRREGAENAELWRMPTAGGEEARIAESVCPQFFSVVERGVYFFSRWLNPSVRCFNFASGKVETVAEVPGDMAYGFSVSPDSRWLLFSKYENWEGDLMLVDHYR